jgi:hypothetical protein
VGLSYETELKDSDFPPLWLGTLPLSSFIEPLMHCLFLGIIKSIVAKIKQWLKFCLQNKAFLEAAAPLLKNCADLQIAFYRILGFGGGLVSENYIALVCSFKTIYCPTLRKVAGDCKGIDDIEHLIVATHAMMLHMMQSEATEKHCDILDEYIKIFLSCVCCVDKSMLEVPKSTNLENKGNFWSILNFLEQFRMLGPLIKYWDGHHEHFIQILKPFMRSP